MYPSAYGIFPARRRSRWHLVRCRMAPTRAAADVWITISIWGCGKPWDKGSRDRPRGRGFL